jgi:flagellar basal-body rod protein FlgF
MDPGLVSSLSGAVAQARRVDVIANNISNVDTAGFKGDDLAFEEHLQGAHRVDSRSDIPERPFTESELLSRTGDERRAVLHGNQFTDFSSGAFRRTGNPLDVAIVGNGFLEILTPEGIRLTRAGSLTLDPGGRLVTHDGFLVLGRGAPGADPALRAITIGNSHIVVDPQGNIYSEASRGGAPLGSLSLVSVENPSGLKKAGRNLFEYSDEALVRPAGANAAAAGARNPASEISSKPNPLGPTSVAPTVQQGALESSNVNAVLEMTKMIEAQRLYEQNIKLMQSFGSLSEKAAELGRF